MANQNNTGSSTPDFNAWTVRSDAGDRYVAFCTECWSTRRRIDGKCEACGVVLDEKPWLFLSQRSIAIIQFNAKQAVATHAFDVELPCAVCRATPLVVEMTRDVSKFDGKWSYDLTASCRACGWSSLTEPRYCAEQGW